MTLEEAIKTAIRYEEKVRDVYREAAGIVTDPVGRRILNDLGADEEVHLNYLKERLAEWKKDGRISSAKLETAIPQRERIDKAFGRHQSNMSRKARGDEKRVLSRALKVEIETSRFYNRMVQALTGDEREMFAQFLEIEERHIGAVQAELDYYSKTGYWFDFKEFDME
jgi:rubrerythrin